MEVKEISDKVTEAASSGLKALDFIAKFPTIILAVAPLALAWVSPGSIPPKTVLELSLYTVSLVTGVHTLLWIYSMFVGLLPIIMLEILQSEDWITTICLGSVIVAQIPLAVISGLATLWGAVKLITVLGMV